MIVKNVEMVKILLLFSVVTLFSLSRLFAQPSGFKFHFIEKDADWITSAQQTTLSDMDNDGDMDIVSKEWANGSVYYLENRLAK